MSAVLALDAEGRNRTALLNLGGVVLGGQLAAHCVVAAMADGADREPASLHTLFLAAPDPRRHYRAEMTSLREGRRIAHRRVGLVQDGSLLVDARVVLRAEAVSGTDLRSFPGAMPDVAPPEAMVPRALRPDSDAFERLLMTGHPCIEIRIPPGYRPGMRWGTDGKAHYWMRIPASAGLTPREHYALLALATDFWFTLPVHALDPGEGRPAYYTSSLDHAVWFHLRPDCSQWLLVETEGSAVHHGLGMLRAVLWTRDGEAVATVVQQTMIRG